MAGKDFCRFVRENLNWDVLGKDFKLSEGELTQLIDSFSVVEKEHYYYQKNSWNDEFTPSNWSSKFSPGHPGIFHIIFKYFKLPFTIKLRLNADKTKANKAFVK